MGNNVNASTDGQDSTRGSRAVVTVPSTNSLLICPSHRFQLYLFVDLLIWNILDVKETVPEILESVKEFEAPPSPISSYSNPYPDEDDFAKDPPMLPPQLHAPSFGVAKSEEEKPLHVMLNRHFIQEGWAPRHVLALGLTHRYSAKYVAVVLYKPLPKK